MVLGHNALLERLRIRDSLDAEGLVARGAKES
ncbi:MAG: hypothetical protein Greene041679_618, partial [Parcubacteria group bacterium Greene0416_79]